MKTMRPRSSLLILALAFTIQLSFAATPAPAKTANLFVTATAKSMKRGARCRRKCFHNYQLCTRGIVPPKLARCRERLRACLRHCG